MRLTSGLITDAIVQTESFTTPIAPMVCWAARACVCVCVCVCVCGVCVCADVETFSKLWGVASEMFPFQTASGSHGIFRGPHSRL